LEYLSGFLSFVYISCCLLLIGIVLLQKGEQGGLGGAFGGGGGDTAFGVKADTTWKRATIVIALLFIVLSIFLGVLKRPLNSVVRSVGEDKESSTIPENSSEENRGSDENSIPVTPSDEG